MPNKQHTPHLTTAKSTNSTPHPNKPQAQHMNNSKLNKYHIEIYAYCNNCWNHFEDKNNLPCQNNEECEVTDYKAILDNTQPSNFKQDALKQIHQIKCKTCKANCHLEKSLPMCEIEAEIDSYCIHKRLKTISKGDNKYQ